jgi:hypothetical protein
VPAAAESGERRERPDPLLAVAEVGVEPFAQHREPALELRPHCRRRQREPFGDRARRLFLPIPQQHDAAIWLRQRQHRLHDAAPLFLRLQHLGRRRRGVGDRHLRAHPRLTARGTQAVEAEVARDACEP